jgi:acetyltransferase EpsM
MATAGPATQGADPDPGVTSRPLVVLGAGEHARVVADAARTRPDEWRLVGFTDPHPAGDAAERLGLEHLGGDDRLAAWPADEQPWLVLGFGDLDARRATVERLGAGHAWATVVHAAAWASPAATLGPGSVVLAGAVVNTGAVLGAHAIVNSGSVVEHDVRVGDHAHVGPGAVVGGGARIGGQSFVGLGARIRDHVTVGERAVVGMGSVVVDDVPDGATVIGHPARSAG